MCEVIFEQGWPYTGKLVVSEGNGPVTTPPGRQIVNDGRWHHAALVHDGQGAVRSYVDSQLDTEYDQTHHTTCMGNGLIANYPAPNHSFEGEMDEFMILRRALSAAEVAAMARAGAAAAGSAPAPASPKPESPENGPAPEP